MTIAVQLIESVPNLLIPSLNVSWISIFILLFLYLHIKIKKKDTAKQNQLNYLLYNFDSSLTTRSGHFNLLIKANLQET